jgi:NADPH2:quinone reductase
LPSYPHGIGSEAVGRVAKLGDGVAELSVGQRVAYVTGGPGAYASHRNVPARLCVPLPDSLSDVDAAAVMLKGLTVEYLIHRTYAVRAGQLVLWHAAAGGVGSIACQWLKHKAARVIGTVGGAEKVARARALGCEFPVDYNTASFVDVVREVTGGQMLDVVYDAVGRRTLDESLACLAPRGLLVSFGNASGTPAPVDLLRLSTGGSLFVTRPRLFDYVATRPELLAAAGRLFDVLGTGAVKPQPSVTLPLHEVAEAHRLLESRATQGSIVLTV